jgi:hypothetical protein
MIEYEDRFWKKVKDLGDCWEWCGCRDRKGYGKFWIGPGKVYGRNYMAHRVAYELVVGLIPSNLEADHLCSHSWCVNPLHLEPVTRKENNSRRSQRRTHCLYGHKLTPDNLINCRQGRKRCKTCGKMQNIRFKRKQILLDRGRVES